MNEARPKCRLCGEASTEDLGEIPDSDYFAGRVLSTSLAGGRLFRCGTCRSMFRHPLLPAAEYLELYRRGVATQWSGGSGREDMRIARAILAVDSSAERVLDIGCGTGEFLDSLPPNLQKFGVEPSAAADLAGRRGIKILAAEITEVSAEAQFDAITLIDVIEHVPHPGLLLAEAYRRIRPGGRIIVSTGDPQSRMWRFFGRRFWYVGFPEHISFPSSEFCRQWCASRDALARETRRTRYQVLGVGAAALSFAMQMAYWVSPRLFNSIGRAMQRLRPDGSARRRAFAPGIPGLFRDHHILTIEKPRLA